MATSNTSPVMQLPIDLFPVHAKDYTMAWAKNTYEYAHIFMENVNAAIYDSLKDVELWKQHAILLRSIIMKQGAIEAKKYMVYLAQKKFKITPPNRQTPVSSYNEIMSVIQTPAWYNSDTNERRKEIYLMVYGCYRRGKNDWALSWCNEWKKKYNIEFVTKEKNSGESTNTRTGKECIYKIFISQASNSIQDHVKSIMSRVYNEYICVRENKNDKDTTYEKCTVNGDMNFYVAKGKPKIDDSVSLVQRTKSETKHQLQKAKNLGIGKEEVLKIVDNVYDASVIKSESEASKGKYFLFAIIFETNNILFCFCSVT